MWCHTVSRARDGASQIAFAPLIALVIVVVPALGVLRFVRETLAETLADDAG